MRDALASERLAFGLIEQGLVRSTMIDAECISARPVSGLILVVWVLKREVRAFGGCLGMHRR